MCRFVLFQKKNELQGPPSAPVPRQRRIQLSVVCAAKLIARRKQRVKAVEVSYGTVCLGEFAVMCMFSSYNGGRVGWGGGTRSSPLCTASDVG